MGRGMRGWITALLLAVAFWAGSAGVGAAAERVERLDPRPGVTLNVLVQEPEHPVGCVVLFAGGDGNLRLDELGKPGWGADNFLVRSRALFVARGFVTAVPDAPSDRRKKGLAGDYRAGPEHAADVGVLVSFLKERYGQPVWLMGTSRGAISAANAASRLGAGQVAGLVLASGVTRDGRNGPGLRSVALDFIRMPVLILHHAGDACPNSPPDDARNLPQAFSASSRVQFIELRGGEAGTPDARCGGRSHHGFLGMEDEVVGRIADWIGRTGKS